MSDLRASYCRLLAGDDATPQTYTDAQLLAVCDMPPEASVLPAGVQLAGVLTAHRFPVPEPETEIIPSEDAPDWGTLTEEEWAELTAEDWAGVTE